MANKKCDICGDIYESSNLTQIYDENYNKVNGIYQCENCFIEKLNIKEDESKHKHNNTHTN